MLSKKKILYAGDGPLGGPANYLAGIIRSLGIDMIHIEPTKRLTPSVLKENIHAVILSDYPRKNLPSESEKLLVSRIRAGTGLMMVGGWASFSGPYGGWRDSSLAAMLPVACRSSDDRLNFPSGALVFARKRHELFSGIKFSPQPVICGLNRVSVKPWGHTLLSARKIISSQRSLRLDSTEYPLLVVPQNTQFRIIALMTDLAPHWCGGLVDWGRRRVTLRVAPRIHIEVGEGYIRFVSCLLRWLLA